MKTARIVMQGLAVMIIATSMMPSGLSAQESGGPEQAVAEQEQAVRFSKEELTQMLAPIALYPDSLVSQILMASTYPIEIVDAERWLRQNKDLKGDALDSALQDKTWDPSVKSLCHFPDLLFSLSDKLDQTRRLGDAFLVQQEEVMATIQDLRRRAEDQGNLKTTEQQKIIDDPEAIRIEPADPQVVYVPVYDPLYVYGLWRYPGYPPYYWYYPPAYPVIGGHIIFGPHFYWGGLFAWSWFDWNRLYIFIDYGRTRRFHRHHLRRDFDRPFHWRHDPHHRKGVAYRDRWTSDRFSGRSPLRRPSITPETRGFPGGGERRDMEPLRRPAELRHQPVTPRGIPERDMIRRAPLRETPFRGIGEGGFERRSGERGRTSRDMELRRQEMGQPSDGMKSPVGEVRPSGGQRGGGSPGERQGGGLRR
ncbi:MAG: DUF3300 domain-containing protein [Nitrospirales bacterium]|nr:DUF3300 domain-containing protein [Nitrospirales bacterium]